MIDAHCHLNISYTTDTVLPTIKRFQELGGTALIDVSTNKDELQVSLQLAKHQPNIWINTAIHPERVAEASISQEQLFSEIDESITLAQQAGKLVGIGETGFDLYYKTLSDEQLQQVMKKQEELLEYHLAKAKELAVPLIIHARGSHQTDYSPYTKALAVLQRTKFTGGVYFHSYVGTVAIAQEILKNGYKLGVNGIATYSNAENVMEVVRYAPLDSLLLETDAPFLIPSNLDRKLLGNSQINEPMSVYYVAKRIAAIKQLPLDEVLATTDQTTRRFFAKML